MTLSQISSAYDVILDFEEFNDRAGGVSNGIFAVEVDIKKLKTAMSIASLAVGKSLNGFDTVRLTLLPTGKLKIAGSDVALGTMVETFVSARFDIAAIPALGLHFGLSASVLTKIAATFRGPDILLSYDPEKMRVIAQSGSTRVEVPAIPNKEFVSYHPKLQSWKHLRAIPLDTMRSAVDFAKLFARDEPGGKAVSDLNILEHVYKSRGREYRLPISVGGSLTAISAFQSQALVGLDLMIRRDVSSVLSKVLARLDPEETHMFDAGQFYLLRDRNSFFGFEKGRGKFPATAIQRYLSFEPDQIVSVSRKDVLAALSRLSIGSSDSNLLLQIGVATQGDATEASIALKVEDEGGRISEDRIEAAVEVRRGNAPYHTAAVRAGDLSKSLSHFADHPVVKFSVSPSGVRIFDGGEGFTAMTILMNAAHNVVEQVQGRRAVG